MKFAILGGTHGNEFVGIEVIKALREYKLEGCLHSYTTFLANPEAYRLKKRFIDFDLNRAFGTKSQPFGYEAKRAQELESQIKGKFDFLLDLHTTTSNMGLTIFINSSDIFSIKAACFLQEKFPEIVLIKTLNLNEDSPYTVAMAKSGLIIEVGPVANNVVSADLVLKTYEMIKELLAFDFKREFDFLGVEYYQTLNNVSYPTQGNWFIHPEIEMNSFSPINPGDQLFINIKGERLPYEGSEPIYPFFINEAAYQTENIALSGSRKTKGLIPVG